MPAPKELLTGIPTDRIRAWVSALPDREMTPRELEASLRNLGVSKSNARALLAANAADEPDSNAAAALVAMLRGSSAPAGSSMPGRSVSGYDYR